MLGSEVREEVEVSALNQLLSVKEKYNDLKANVGTEASDAFLSTYLIMNCKMLIKASDVFFELLHQARCDSVFGNEDKSKFWANILPGLLNKVAKGTSMLNESNESE